MSGSADLAEAYRAAVATRVIAMLTPSEASEVASAPSLSAHTSRCSRRR